MSPKNPVVYVKTITLENPIKWGEDEVIKEVNLRKPKSKDLRGLKSDLGFTELLDLTVKVSDQPRGVIDELEGADIMNVLEVVGDFFGVGLKAGKEKLSS